MLRMIYSIEMSPDPWSETYMCLIPRSKQSIKIRQFRQKVARRFVQ
jgi:hypothetical protein